MKAINTGDTYEIYGDSLRTYDALPPLSYSVEFSKMTGFFLKKHSDIEINEDKIYGVHINKVEKVLSSFNVFERNLGVILSGDKGIGKSLFAKLLSVKAIENNLPVIIVDKYIPGVASFIDSIDQKVMILFDEFDKTFSDCGDEHPQTEMLTLFDGLSHGKKLFVITCNEIRVLNKYLINRPGRFHYHFRFEYPSVEEIKEYLEDKLEPQYYKEIKSVISFSRKVNLNYDCLRAIAFELSGGGEFKEIIKDLNIVNFAPESYALKLYYNNGMVAHLDSAQIDLFDDSERFVGWLYNDDGEYVVRISFNVSDCIFDETKMCNVVAGDNVELKYVDADDDFISKIRNAKAQYLTITRNIQKGLHYNIS